MHAAFAMYKSCNLNKCFFFKTLFGRLAGQLFGLYSGVGAFSHQVVGHDFLKGIGGMHTWREIA